MRRRAPVLPEERQYYYVEQGDIFLQDDGTTIGKKPLAGVNAIAFYRKTLKGLKKAQAYIFSLSGKDLDDLDRKLEWRRRLDDEELEGAELDVKSLPQAKWRGARS